MVDDVTLMPSSFGVLAFYCSPNKFFIQRRMKIASTISHFAVTVVI